VSHVVRVKVCGITTEADAWAAIELGVDALGFLVGLLHESEDALSAHDAGKIVAGLPPFIGTTLVTHRADPADVLDLLGHVRPQVVQLHGAYPPGRIPTLRDAFPATRVIKTVHVDGEASIAAAVEAARYADGVLLDSRTPTRIGGTGLTHDWSSSRRIRDTLAPTPVILAGGLTPDNVADAIERVQPYAVDVNSGVSLRRGKKSPPLIAAFVRAARKSMTITMGGLGGHVGAPHVEGLA
jgi:phosphoribosylanthranilate isomerase